jgi:hypothetical protein
MFTPGLSWSPARVRTRALVVLAAGLLTVPLAGLAQDAEGFDGYVTSGSCAEPTDAVRVQLDGGEGRDVVPYEAVGAQGDNLLLGYYGAPQLPGFGVGAIYTDQDFSLVVTDGGGRPVACGDLLVPQREEFTEVGTAVVQLAPVGESTVQGVAVVTRARLERERDVIPTHVRIVLDAEAGEAAGELAESYEGYVQGGRCGDADDLGVRVQLRTLDDAADVRPFPARLPSGEEVVPAYYGAPLAPGFGLAAAYSNVAFSLVITDEADAPVACGDVLRPTEQRYTEAGLALVRLEPAGDEGPRGFALVERLGMERELDVTPTRVRVLLFTPPIG